MATNPEWLYAKNSQQLGPISTAKLKEVASSGKLSATDLIWTEGWEEWRAAGTVKGLFDSAPPAKPGPPPLPRPANSDQLPSATFSETVKSDFSDFIGVVKRGKDLAVAQTRRTQLTTLTLPKAYLELGKDVFLNDRFRDEFGDLFQRIASTNDEIAKAKAVVSEDTKATDLKGKLQTGAGKLLAQGQAATLTIRRESLVRELGKKAFEKHGSAAGSPELISAITGALEQIAKLDAEIHVSPTSKGVTIWQRIPLAAVLTVGCFPVGLLLVWLNPRLSRPSKALWIGGVVAVAICLGTIARYSIEKAKAELAVANELWNADDKPAAIAKYRELVKNHLHAIPDSERSLIMGRVIDFDAESGNQSSAEELVRLADEEQIVLSLSSEKARSLRATTASERTHSPASAPMSRFSFRQQLDYIVKNEFGISADEAKAISTPGKAVDGMVYEEREGTFSKERREGVIRRDKEELKRLTFAADHKIDRIEAMSRDGASFYPSRIWHFEHYSFDLPTKEEHSSILTHPASITELDGTGWRIEKKLIRFYRSGQIAYECYGTSNNGAIDYRKHDPRNRYWDASGKEMDMAVYCSAADGKEWQEHFANSESKKGRANVENFLDAAKQNGLINDRGAKDMINRMENSGTLPRTK